MTVKSSSTSIKFSNPPFSNPFKTPKKSIGCPTKKGKVSPKTLGRRLIKALSNLIKLCDESDIEMFNCLGLLGQKFYMRKGPNYDNARGQLFHHIAHNILTTTSTDLVGVPLDVCLYVMSSTEIGDTKYDNLRKTLAPFVNLATKNRVRTRKHEICPKYENTRNQGSFLKLSSLVSFFFHYKR